MGGVRSRLQKKSKKRMGTGRPRKQCTERICRRNPACSFYINQLSACCREGYREKMRVFKKEES